MDINELTWQGDLEDHCFIDQDGVMAVCEFIDDEWWHVTVTIHEDMLFDSAELGHFVALQTGKAAREFALKIIEIWNTGRNFTGSDGF